MIIEGVRYHQFRVTFRLTTGQRRRWVRWSPGQPWVYEEVGRELFDRFGINGVKAHSCKVVPL